MRDRFAGRVSPDELEDLRVIVSELTTNALLHGAGEIHLLVQLDEGVVCGEVLDDGGGFADTDSAGRAGGNGLDMVGALAERWGVQDGTSRVWFELAASGGVRQPVRGDRAVIVAP
ncbi:MAG: ATP-binding protein [Solirubrobacteraceae bacterium]|nr:ATP-binding protein [Solirubrobacteraceae bacterium]